MKIKHYILLLFAAGIFVSETYAADSAIIMQRNNPSSSSLKPSEYRFSKDEDAVYNVRYKAAGIDELQKLLLIEPDDYDVYPDLVYAYLRERRYEDALDTLIYLYKLKKKNAASSSIAAELNKVFSAYKRMGRRNGGLDLNLAVMSVILDDSDAVTYLAEGAASVKNKGLVKKAMRTVFDNKTDNLEAIAQCSKVIVKNPENAEIRKIKAEYHVRASQFKEAEEEYAKVLALDFSDDDSRYEYYKILDASKTMDEKLMIKKLYGASPSFEYEKSYVSMINLLIERKKYRAAEAFASSMIKKYPQNPNGYIYKAQVLQYEGKIKEAYDLLAAARNKADSAETASKYNVLLAKLSTEPVKEAQTLIANGLYDQALQVLEGANPADLNVLLTQADAEFYLRHSSSAVDYLNKAMSLFPNNPHVYTSFARVYYQDKDYETARKYADLALRANPQDGNAQNMLDLINRAESKRYVISILDEMEMENYTEAMRLINEALEVDSKSADLYYYKGLVHTAQNDYQQSAEAMSRCLEIDKNYIDAWFYLAAAFDNLGEKETALDYYKKFLDMSEGNEIGRSERIDYAKLRVSKLEQN